MLRLLVATSTLVGVLGAGSQAASMNDQLTVLRGSTRPLVILSDARDDPRVVRQLAALDHARPGLDARNVKVLQEARPGSAMRMTLGVPATGFAVVLVGKDGGVKKVWRDPVAPQRIFTIIDTMPMRQQEMRG